MFIFLDMNPASEIGKSLFSSSLVLEKVWQHGRCVPAPTPTEQRVLPLHLHRSLGPNRGPPRRQRRGTFLVRRLRRGVFALASVGTERWGAVAPGITRLPCLPYD